MEYDFEWGDKGINRATFGEVKTPVFPKTELGSTHEPMDPFVKSGLEIGGDRWRRP